MSRRHPDPRGGATGGFGSGEHPDDHTLQLAAEGLAEPGVMERVQAHATDCARCAGVLASYGELLSQLNAVPVAEAPAALAEAVLSAYERGKAPVASLWSDRKLLVAAALINVLLVAMMLTRIGVHGPVDWVGDSAIALKNTLLTALDLIPAIEAVWTVMAHGGIALVAALAIALLGTVAALRRTLRLAEDTP